MAARHTHRDYALVPLSSRQALYVTCASRQEIEAANRRLQQWGLPLRYVPHQANQPTHCSRQGG
jgi:hypothetical protein